MAFYEIHFQRPIIAHEIRVQFQGGFAGMDCVVFRKKCLESEKSDTQNDDSVEWEEFDELFLDAVDSSDIQTFPVEASSDVGEGIETPYTALRIEFGKSGDFYGRIVMYSLEVWGTEVQR